MSVQDRNAKVQAVIESLERDMELLCLTGVEDKLQEGVRPTLELLRNAGIKVPNYFHVCSLLEYRFLCKKKCDKMKNQKYHNSLALYRHFNIRWQD